MTDDRGRRRGGSLGSVSGLSKVGERKAGMFTAIKRGFNSESAAVLSLSIERSAMPVNKQVTQLTCAEEEPLLCTGLSQTDVLMRQSG